MSDRHAHWENVYAPRAKRGQLVPGKSGLSDEFDNGRCSVSRSQTRERVVRIFEACPSDAAGRISDAAIGQPADGRLRSSYFGASAACRRRRAADKGGPLSSAAQVGHDRTVGSVPLFAALDETLKRSNHLADFGSLRFHFRDIRSGRRPHFGILLSPITPQIEQLTDAID